MPSVRVAGNTHPSPSALAEQEAEELWLNVNGGPVKCEPESVPAREETRGRRDRAQVANPLFPSPGLQCGETWV